MVQTDRQTPLSPLDYHYNVVEFSRSVWRPLLDSLICMPPPADLAGQPIRLVTRLSCNVR